MPKAAMTQTSASEGPKPIYAGLVPAVTGFRTEALKLLSTAETTRISPGLAMRRRHDEGDHWKLTTGPEKSWGRLMTFATSKFRTARTLMTEWKNVAMYFPSGLGTQCSDAV